jgi:hypothetical protein
LAAVVGATLLQLVVVQVVVLAVILLVGLGQQIQ